MTSVSDATSLISSRTISFQEAFDQAGSQHKFQKRLILLLSLQRISIGFLFTVFPFLFKTPEFLCKDTEQSEPYICRPSPETCKLNIFPSPEDQFTLISTFRLYCDYGGSRDVAENLFTFACILGTIFLTPLADRIGRRPGIFISFFFGSLSLVLLPFVESYFLFCVLFALAGFGISPYLTNSLLLYNEFSDVTMRATGTVIINLSWTCGQIVVGIFAFIFRNNWRHLLACGVGVPLFLSIPFLIFWTHESPMYLLSQKQYYKAREILEIVSHVNQRQLPTFEFLEGKADLSPVNQTKRNIFEFKKLFQFKSLRYSTSIAACLSLTIYFNYYGTIFALSSIQVNTYILTISLALTEMLAYYLLSRIVSKVSRRLTFAMCLSLCCLANILFVLNPIPSDCADKICSQTLIQFGLSLLNRFSVALAMVLSSLYVNEIFPTAFRALGSGVTVFAGRIGTFFATIGIALCSHFDKSPILLFGLICIPGIIASCIAKETKGLPLPETIEEENTSQLENSIEETFKV